MSSESESSPTPVLSLDEKRQVIYASLLRFGPEAMSLRQRALERVVLSGLLGSSEEKPFKVDNIQRNLQKRPQAPELREEIIRDTLNHLISDEKVKRFELKSSKSYCLTQKGAEEINRALEQAVDIFEPVMRRMLRDIEHLISFEVGATLCRSFIMECFARFGRQIAHSVVGRLDREDLARSSEVDAAFKAAMSGKNLAPEIRESLYNRCVQFLRSSEPEDEQLKLRLTQGFFLAELLCIHGIPFDPLSTQAFKGAVLYIDTNIVLMGLLTTEKRSELFEEILRLASRLGIELRITRATINEARHVIANRRIEMEKYIKSVPEKLNELTYDDFLSAYIDARAHEPELTPRQFLAPFEQLTEILEQKWKVIIVDLDEDEILGKRSFEREATIIQEEVKTSTRPRDRKPDQVLRHDLAHLALVGDERPQNPKTWFLTADRSLVRAALRLISEKKAPQAAAAAAAATSATRRSQTPPEAALPFCFSLAGFLQSISPFTASAGEEGSLADIFSALVTEYLSLSDNLFDMREMNLLVELHEDVMSTPSEELIPALDYVKKKVLEGRQYSTNELPKIALELKKFLSKSAEERERALQIEADRRAEEIRREQQARANAEEAARLKDEENVGLRSQISQLGTESEQQAKNIADLSETITREKELREKQEHDQLQERERARALRLRDRMIVGFVVGAAVWFFADSIVQLILAKGINPDRWGQPVRVVVNGLGILSFCLPSLFYIRSTSWRSEVKASAYAFIALLAISFSRLLDDTTLTRWASYIGIAVFISGFLYLLLSKKQ
jgi:predicted nucleic acid-binding protein